jgi:hypothetical protein
LTLCAIAGAALLWLLWQPADRGRSSAVPGAAAARGQQAAPVARQGSQTEPLGAGSRFAYRRAPGPSEGPGSSGADAARATADRPAGDDAAGAPSPPSAGIGRPGTAAAYAEPGLPSAASAGSHARDRERPGTIAPPSVAPDSHDILTPDAPLTPEQVAAKVDEALDGLSPEEREVVEPVVTRDTVDKVTQAQDWVGATPRSEASAEPFQPAP